MSRRELKGLFFWPILLLALSVVLNLSLGSIYIPTEYIFTAFFSDTNINETWHYILMDYRLPKAITAILVGGGLSVSGLLMQTLFRNPLAGPFVLGISSGASLGVAFLVLGSGVFGGLGATLLSGPWAMVIASATGSFLVLLAVISAASKIKDAMALLIIGLMFGSLTGAIVSVLSYFSRAEALQQFVFWSFGGLGHLSWTGVIILLVSVIIGLVVTIASLKSMNALLLGPQYAQSLGISLRKSTFLMVLATSILAGSITAFAGPIAFIGLAVPHLVRQIIGSPDHKIMVPSSFLWGSIIMLLCDTVAQIPFSSMTLPINAITSILGAPVVIWILLRRKNLLF
ncbi:iron ABC transporter permease [Flavobacteriaceae bacterium]|nr:iron ABC transporter permease [Flavobacteriaceae bacterium]MDB2463281.1 iron ABC transporter permease [Flavobacteriaceae bacterium]